MRWRYVAYGACSLFKTLLHNIFLLYHIEVFVAQRHISATGFWCCESMFLVYNSLNDFVAGALSDHTLLDGIALGMPLKGVRDTAVRVTAGTLKQRIRCVLSGPSCSDGRALTWGGPALCATFLLFWFEWTSYTSLQLTVALVAYDGALSYFDVNHSALLADLATNEAERARFNMYSSFFSALGSLSVFASYIVWDADDQIG